MADLPKPDTVLLAQTAAGNRAAWHELRDRHSLNLYAQVFVLVGEPVETEQVVTETMQQAWCSAAQFDLSGDVTASAWLAGLARGVLLARRRDETAVSLRDEEYRHHPA